jgi:signal transduction histidine kinase/ActR/RegA family two-component response regulator
MKRLDIRARLLLTALLPVTLLGIVLAAVFLFARVTDVGEAHQQRARSLVRQLASASEYGLFSGNTTHLQAVAFGALREPDVLWVALLDAQGQQLVRAGQGMPARLPVLSTLESAHLDTQLKQDWLVQPIVASQVNLDDLFDAPPIRSATPQVLGHVVVAFSRQALDQRERDMLWVGVAVTLVGMLFGSFLAWRLGRGVIVPILRVSGLIGRIGRGELSARGKILPNDPLSDLQMGLNQMAERLEQGRDELEQRITIATGALREKKEEAETATLAKSRFLAAASHDLRQPTHALGMFVARLAQLPHDRETHQLIGNLEASVQAMQDLLDALLDISRLDAQSVPVQLRPFALGKLFDQLNSTLSLTAEQKGLRLRVRPTSVWLLTDPALLERILLNLLGNALRYTPHGGVLLACRLAADGQYARIEVWDSGIGIAPEQHQDVFKEFFQVGNSERDQGKGLGLGLNIVQRTAGLLDLPIHMQSGLGCGTRFSLRVPLAPEGTDHDRRSAPRADPMAQLSGLVVLVVEDNSLARDGLVSLLTSWGCVVGSADGLAQALQQLEDGLMAQVIISDYRLGEGDNGIALIRQLRLATGLSIPACLMSGDTDPSLIQAAKHEGLTLLHKPVRPAKLRSLLRRLANEVHADDMGLV